MVRAVDVNHGTSVQALASVQFSLSCQSSTHTQTTHRALDFGDFHRAIQISRSTARDLMPCARAFLRLFIAQLQAGHFQLQEGVELLTLKEPEVEEFLT